MNKEIQYFCGCVLGDGDQSAGNQTLRGSQTIDGKDTWYQTPSGRARTYANKACTATDVPSMSQEDLKDVTDLCSEWSKSMFEWSVPNCEDMIAGIERHPRAEAARWEGDIPSRRATADLLKCARTGEEIYFTSEYIVDNPKFKIFNSRCNSNS